MPVLAPATSSCRQPQEQSSSPAHPFGRRQTLFLPKYSPDLNPVEQVFAKLKHLLRKAAARTVDAVCAAIGKALDAFTPDECANYLKDPGYRT
nr:transposase [Bradyrhizobium vignae]